jgi:hypothetical protein
MRAQNIAIGFCTALMAKRHTKTLEEFTASARMTSSQTVCCITAIVVGTAPVIWKTCTSDYRRLQQPSMHVVLLLLLLLLLLLRASPELQVLAGLVQRPLAPRRQEVMQAEVRPPASGLASAGATEHVCTGSCPSGRGRLPMSSFVLLHIPGCWRTPRHMLDWEPVDWEQLLEPNSSTSKLLKSYGHSIGVSMRSIATLVEPASDQA